MPNVRKGHLVGNTRATVDAGAVDVQSFGEPLDVLPDLLDQLARRRHNQSNRAVVLRPLSGDSDHRLSLYKLKPQTDSIFRAPLYQKK